MAVNLIDRLGSPGVLLRSWPHVAAQRCPAGSDEVTVAQFAADLESHISRLAEEIGKRSYEPLPVMRVRPRYLEPSALELVVPAVRDQLVQRTIADLLSPKIDATLSSSCRAFRRGSSAKAAANDVSRLIGRGAGWVLRGHIRSLFKNIDPGPILKRFAAYLDEESAAFLADLIRANVLDQHQVGEMVSGIPQGAPLAPFLANLHLADFDHAMTRLFRRYLRYGYDMVVLASDEETVRQAQDELRQRLDALSVHLDEERTRVVDAEQGFDFLGYRFDSQGHVPAAKSVEMLYFRLDQMVLEETLDEGELGAVYRTWTKYFGGHPECWAVHPVGALCLLHRASHAEEILPAEQLAEVRWSLPQPVTPHLALALGQAWHGAGMPEQAWFELAALLADPENDQPDLAEWSRFLGAEPEQLQQIFDTLTGEPGDRLAALAEVVRDLGEGETADRLAAFGSSPFTPPDQMTTVGVTDEETEEEDDIAALGDWFQGRSGVHAVESVNSAGHHCFVLVPRPITGDDWQAHLRGERTLALAPVRADQTALLGVLQIDVERQFIDRELRAPDDEHLTQALSIAVRLRTEAERRGCAALLVLSGYRGYHLWLRLDGPVRAADLGRWLLEVIEVSEPLPEGVRITAVPSPHRLRGSTVGPWIKLPLGYHSRTGLRCDLLDARGQPLADSMGVLTTTPRMPAAVIRRWAGELRAGRLTKIAEDAITGEAANLLEQCPVLRALQLRAEANAHLSHSEREVLLFTLGHLGDEGAGAIHAILSHCHEYRSESVARMIRRLPAAPMSCPKIRARLPQVTQTAGCSCHFELGGAYPTPILHVLEPSVLPLRRAQQKAATTDEKPVSDPTREAEQLLREIGKLLTRRRHLDSTLEQRRQALAELFDRIGSDTLKTDRGVLRRVKRDQGWDFLLE